MEMGPNAHTSMHAFMIQFLSIKRQLLSTLKRDDHRQLACNVSSENHEREVPNQIIKTSKACNNGPST